MTIQVQNPDHFMVTQMSRPLDNAKSQIPAQKSATYQRGYGYRSVKSIAPDDVGWDVHQGSV